MCLLIYDINIDLFNINLQADVLSFDYKNTNHDFVRGARCTH